MIWRISCFLLEIKEEKYVHKSFHNMGTMRTKARLEKIIRKMNVIRGHVGQNWAASVLAWNLGSSELRAGWPLPQCLLGHRLPSQPQPLPYTLAAPAPGPHLPNSQTWPESCFLFKELQNKLASVCFTKSIL